MTEIVIEEQLSHRVVKGGFWLFALRITQQIFYIIRLIILARLLAPHDFGLFGIAMLTMLTLENFSQTGFQAALIQKKENIDAYLNSAWTVGIIRGAVLFIILFLISPYVAAFFNTPEAQPIIRVIGLSILLQAFTNIGVIYFQKELEFSKQFVYQLSGTLVDFMVAVSIVLILKSVWALVFGLLAGNVIRLILSYFLHPFKPSFSFDTGKAKELFGFGKWILGSSVLVFLLSQGDDAFVGKLLGATMLGFYQMAYRISNTPATEISNVISQVTFPAYSKLQHDIPRLRQAYLKVLQLTAFLSFPIAGLIFVLAPDITRIFLGGKWMPMVPAMQTLCILGITGTMNATIGPVFRGMGKPYVTTYGSGFQLVILSAIIYPLTARWGILGTSLSVIIPSILVMLYLNKMLMNTFNYKLTCFIKSLFLPILCSLLMCSFLFFFKNFTGNFLFGFLLSLFLGISIYLISMYWMDKVLGYKLKSNLTQLVRQAL